MDEIKFRYRLKNKETGDIIEQIYSISAIEHLIAVCPEPYEILSRDQYIGFKDKNDKEWFEKDIIKHINENAGYGDVKQPDDLYTVVPDIMTLYEDDYLLFCMRSGENVGNFYDNPEILN